MILLLASTRRTAEEWFRSSGADPADCVTVVRAAQITPNGVFDDEPSEAADIYLADEIDEIVEVGPARWWLTGAVAETWSELKWEIERQDA